MTPDLQASLITVITALVGALLGWLAKRNTPAPAPPVPAPVIPSPAVPDSPDHPVIKNLLKLLLDALGKAAPLAPLIFEEKAAASSSTLPLSIDLGSHTLFSDADGVHITAKQPAE